MVVDKDDFIQRVLLIMNEAGWFDKDEHSYVGADAAQIDRYIEGSFVDAWRRCVAVLPKAWFFNKGHVATPVYSPDDGRQGYVVLPSDFYMLNQFKMTKWKKPAYDAYIANERTASIQSNPYTRGSNIRPVVTISTKTIGTTPTQVLNFFSEKSEDTIEKFIYIPVMDPLSTYTGSKELIMDQRIIEPMAYLSASTVFTIFEKHEVATALEARVAEMFPAFQSIKGTTVTIKQ